MVVSRSIHTSVMRLFLFYGWVIFPYCGYIQRYETPQSISQICLSDMVELKCKVVLYSHGHIYISSVQSLSHVWLFANPWTVARQASLSNTNSWILLRLMSIELVMPSNHFILCHHLLLLPSILPSIRVFSSESALHIRWPKYWSFSFSISPSNEYSGLISLKMNWLDLLAVQGALKSLLQHHSSKASILWRSAFFMVQLSTSIHDYWRNHSID